MSCLNYEISRGDILFSGPVEDLDEKICLVCLESIYPCDLKCEDVEIYEQVGVHVDTNIDMNITSRKSPPRKSNTYTSYDTIKLKCCNAIFHEGCVVDYWLTSQKQFIGDIYKCPQCRQSICPCCLDCRSTEVNSVFG